MKLDLILKPESESIISKASLGDINDNTYLYRWFESEDYRDKFFHGHIYFSSAAWLQLFHDPKESYYQSSSHSPFKTTSIFNKGYSLCLTRNNTAQFWQDKQERKMTYGVKINLENFFESIKRSLVKACTCNDASSQLWIELIDQDSLLNKLGLSSNYDVSKIRFVLDKIGFPHNRDKLVDVAIGKNVFEEHNKVIKLDVAGFSGYQMTYYDQETSHNLSPDKRRMLCVSKPDMFKGENEYRLSLSISLDHRYLEKIIKFVIIKCELEPGCVEKVENVSEASVLSV